VSYICDNELQELNFRNDWIVRILKDNSKRKNLDYQTKQKGGVKQMKGDRPTGVSIDASWSSWRI